MSDTEQEKVVVAAAEEEEQHQEQEQEQKQQPQKPTMSSEPEETLQQHQPQHQTEINRKFENISLSIWPPTQRTRDAVINRLIETLSAPSILSKRYGSLPTEQSSSIARSIEEEAFSSATSAAASASASASETNNSNTAETDGIEILQIYSKEISKRMLDAVKAKAASANPPPENAAESSPVPATSEEISSVEPESS